MDDGNRLQGRGADGNPEEVDTDADEAGVKDLFKCKLYNLCIVNAGFVMKIVYGIAKQVLDPMKILKFKMEGEKRQGRRLFPPDLR